MREKQEREREMGKESNICLDVLVGLLGGAHDVHAMTPGVVQLRQLHEVKHLDIAPNQEGHAHKYKRITRSSSATTKQKLSACRERERERERERARE